MIKKILTLLLPFLYTLAIGNGLEINNLSVNDSYTQATFDISWENSWRQTERFHDAVWIYIKYKPDNSIQWEHANISGGTASGNLELVPQADEMGIFIRNASDFTGNVPATSITLDIAVDSTIAIYPDFEVYGIEMVYVPDGGFYIGDGGDYALESYHIYYGGSEFESEGDDNPFISRIYYDQGNNEPVYPVFTIDGQKLFYQINYPYGYDAFYCMKYKFTQQQLVDYLNHTTQDAMYSYGAENTGSLMNTNAARNGLHITDSTLESGVMWAANDLNENGVYNEADDGQFLAQYFSLNEFIGDDSVNIALYFDLLNWTGMRPMTETEFEKVSRGPLLPIRGEKAWGRNDFSTTSYTINNSGTSTETVIYGSTSFPDPLDIFRVGFASFNSTTRTGSLSGYWGVHDLSTNGSEAVISLTHQSFTGVLGNGNPGTYPSDWGDFKSLITKRAEVSNRVSFLSRITGRGVRKP